MSSTQTLLLRLDTLLLKTNYKNKLPDCYVYVIRFCLHNRFCIGLCKTVL